VPLDEDKGRISYNTIWGSRARLREHHNDMAETMAPLGIERGKSGDTPSAKDINEYYGLVHRYTFMRDQQPKPKPIPLVGLYTSSAVEQAQEQTQTALAALTTADIRADERAKKKYQPLIDENLALIKANGEAIAAKERAEADLKKYHERLREISKAQDETNAKITRLNAENNRLKNDNTLHRVDISKLQLELEEWDEYVTYLAEETQKGNTSWTEKFIPPPVPVDPDPEPEPEQRKHYTRMPM